MPTPTWDPVHYLRFADERARPFVELLARVDARAPTWVVDLGCGPGTLTRLLAQRWPQAQVLGWDCSPEMIAAARGLAGDRLRFALGDLREWHPEEPVDVLVSNATLQWIPEHLDLLPRLAASLAPDGWLAVQVPGNFEEPSHTIRRALAAEEPFAAYTQGVAVPVSHAPADYLALLTACGLRVDAWETTYLHVLPGADPVLDWVTGTGARPTVQALPEGALREAFLAEFGRRLREAYPPTPAGVVLPFRRVFVVAHRKP